MWQADGWKEYAVLETDSGEKLERWGDYTLVRPDPQVIWTGERKNSAWKHPNAHYHRSSKGGGQWEFFDLPEQWDIHYDLKGAGRRLTFALKPFSFKHTGLFPEQAVNWEWFSRIISGAASDPQRGEAPRVLNLFAYTGGATLAAAAAGAAVTHVDASRGMVGWARENAERSGLGEAHIRWLVDDCMKFVEREMRRGSRYDGIIMDPPSYGRGPKGEIWKIEDAVFDLVNKCTALLSDDPLFFLINSYTTGLQPGVLSYMLSLTVGRRFGGRVNAGEVGLPIEGRDLVLPCGAAGRWEK
ncbi:MAG: class I SAM-dependent methyltransferase [Lachnospiraceae bacterium]|nr:class I SAM-dependent methyltransferase [Lachnospiraceae bacterium]